MKIRIISVGKNKNDYLKIGIDSYIKMIRPYSQIEIIEVNDEAIVNQKEIEKGIIKEGERILKLIHDNDYVISLDLNKKQLTSIEFAKYLDEKLTISGAYLTFVIGGSYGLSEDVKKRMNDSLSLSKMTFLHMMCRLILLEQIFRAFKINNNETYHK